MYRTWYVYKFTLKCYWASRSSSVEKKCFQLNCIKKNLLRIRYKEICRKVTACSHYGFQNYMQTRSRIWRVRRFSGTSKSCWQTRASEIRHHPSSELFVRRAVSGVWLFKELSRDVLWFPVPETFAYPECRRKGEAVHRRTILDGVVAEFLGEIPEGKRIRGRVKRETATPKCKCLVEFRFAISWLSIIRLLSKMSNKITSHIEYNSDELK